MLSLSLDAMLKMSKMTSPHKLFDSDSITLYFDSIMNNIMISTSYIDLFTIFNVKWYRRDIVYIHR